MGSREHEVVVVEELEEEGEEEEEGVVVVVKVEELEGGARPRCFSSAKVRCRNALSPMRQWSRHTLSSGGGRGGGGCGGGERCPARRRCDCRRVVAQGTCIPPLPIPTLTVCS